MQDCEGSPEEYAEGVWVQKPVHVSVGWGSVGDFFVKVAEVGLNPASAYVRGEGEEEGEDDGEGWMRWWILGGVVCVVGAVGVGIWRRVGW